MEFGLLTENKYTIPQIPNFFIFSTLLKKNEIYLFQNWYLVIVEEYHYFYVNHYRRNVAA